jgi:AcrR family transcriptional regulator
MHPVSADDTGRPSRLATDKTRRSDAQRNRGRLIEVAEAAFASEGLAVPIAEIARRAEVSTGTVSRHFPTKAALVEVVLLTVLDRLADEARALLTADDPGEAFFGYFHRLVIEGTTNKAVFDTLAAAGPDSDLKSAVSSGAAALTTGLGELLARAQQTGAARPDISPDDLSAILVGALAMQSHASPTPSPHLATLAADALRQH